MKLHGYDVTAVTSTVKGEAINEYSDKEFCYIISLFH